ncbi:MAG: hypothetical protein QXO51_07510 [Halobacteria archaeon]
MWERVEAFLARKPGPSESLQLAPNARLYWSMGCVRLAAEGPRPLRLEGGAALERVRALAERHGLGVDLRSGEEAVLHRGGTYVCKLSGARLFGVPERMDRALFEDLLALVQDGGNV